MRGHGVSSWYRPFAAAPSAAEGGTSATRGAEFLTNGSLMRANPASRRGTETLDCANASRPREDASTEVFLRRTPLHRRRRHLPRDGNTPCRHSSATGLRPLRRAGVTLYPVSYYERWVAPTLPVPPNNGVTLTVASVEPRRNPYCFLGKLASVPIIPASRHNFGHHRNLHPKSPSFRIFQRHALNTRPTVVYDDKPRVPIIPASHLNPMVVRM